MKGLILKDLYAIKSFSKQYGMVLAFMLIWSVFMKDSSFIYVFSIMMGAMVIFSVISLDEAVSFNGFALTMPVSIKTLIKEKYLLFIITISIGTVFSLFVNFIMILLPLQSFEGFHLREIMPVLSLFVVGISAAFPIILKKGVEKGRYVYIAAMLGIGAVIYIGAKICINYEISLDAMENMPGILYGGIFAVICIGSLAISYLVSVKLTKNKQWQ